MPSRTHDTGSRTVLTSDDSAREASPAGEEYALDGTTGGTSGDAHGVETGYACRGLQSRASNLSLVRGVPRFIPL
jgi:hypothetical protein